MLELKDYQRTGVEFLVSRKCAYLADDMGLGKSAQAIRACDRLNANRILILGPAVARLNWANEFEKFSVFSQDPFPVSKADGFTGWESSSYAVSYDLAIKPEVRRKLLLQGDYDALILDEAHFLKNHETKRAQLVLGEAGYARHAKRIFALSGTPMPNDPSELWAIARAFGWTQLGYNKWVERYCAASWEGYKYRVHGAKIKDKEAMAELKDLIRANMLRRKKEEVLKELPSISFQRVLVDPGEVDLEVEASFAKWFYPHDRREELRKEVHEQETLLQKLLKNAAPSQRIEILKAMAQSVSTLRMFTACQKVNPVADVIGDELENNAYEKIVIFAHHQGLIEGLRRKLVRFKPLTLYGGTPDEKRNEHIRLFQTEPKHRVFIGNIKACGTAVTLTAASEVAFAEQDWVPGNNAQAAMRVHRIGQTRPVHVRIFSIHDSVDEHVGRVLERKIAEIIELVG